MTQNQGKITGLAKGARKLKHRLCGTVEPFYQVELEAMGGQTFDYIKEVNVLSSAPLHKMGLEAQNAIYFLAELTHRLTVEDQEIEGVFELWKDLMNYWPKHEQKTESLLHAGTIKLLSKLGFMASWQHCGSSHEKLDLGQPIYLNSEEVSLTHVPSQNHTPLSPTMVKWVNFMQNYPLADVLKVNPNQQEKEQVWQLLQNLIYPLLNQPMKTEKFIVMN